MVLCNKHADVPLNKLETEARLSRNPNTCGVLQEFQEFRGFSRQSHKAVILQIISAAESLTSLLYGWMDGDVVFFHGLSAEQHPDFI